MNQQTNLKLPYVVVVGNEKGGAGKTTCSVHLIVSLLEMGFCVGSIDVDSRQHSLTRYLQNRNDFHLKRPELDIKHPKHYLIDESNLNEIDKKQEDEKNRFETSLREALHYCDIVLIDTPGSHTHLSKLAHSYADAIITPINDSFMDLDVMAKFDPKTFEVISPSIYSAMVWDQKKTKAIRSRGTIDWIVVRNRLSNLDAVNKRNVGIALEKLSKRISFKVAPGFSERVIFRELFLHGLTLLDLPKVNDTKSMNVSVIAARQELRDFLNFINIHELIKIKDNEDVSVQ
jgi:chromosome partitioning protein